MDRLTEIQNLSSNILVKNANLEHSVTIPSQVKSAIQMAEVYFKEWDKFKEKHYQNRDVLQSLSNFTFSYDEYQQLLKLVKSNRKIEAIKHVRFCTKSGLKEAKICVDQMEVLCQNENK